MEESDISPENLIAMNRMNLFLSKTLDALERKDPELKKRIKTIKARVKLKQIEISAEAKKEFSIRSSQLIMELLVKCINTLYIKSKGCRITKETIEKATLND